MGALANEEVGKYLKEHFCSSYQKVATFKIVNGNKQGGNVAAYFCAPDGRVLHAVAGPVNAQQFLHEARWIVDTSKKLIASSKGDGAKFKEGLRKAHAAKLLEEFGLAVEATTYDVPEMRPDDALTYRDPTGKGLAPKLPPPPIDGPDVSVGGAEMAKRQLNAVNSPGAAACFDRGGKRWVLGNQGRVHQILAGHGLAKIEQVYGTVFENILGEKISTKPVEVVAPFSWMDKQGNRVKN